MYVFKNCGGFTSFWKMADKNVKYIFNILEFSYKNMAYDDKFMMNFRQQEIVNSNS